MVHNMNKDFLLEIYKSPKTVFSFQDIALILEETSKDALKGRIHYYVKKGRLLSPRRGIYVKPDYDQQELAARIFTPSYISLETVLVQAGVVFQYYESIFVVSYLSRNIMVNGRKITVHKIKNDILYNSEGISQEGRYAVAGKERAFLDAVYIYKDYPFDNAGALDKNKVLQLAEIYSCRELVKRVQRILKDVEH